VGTEIVFWHWWAFAALLMVVELLAPGIFFLWIAEAAFVTGAVLWVIPGLRWEWQLVWFSLLSVLSIAIARRLIRRHPIVGDHPWLNQRASQYIGRVFVLDQPIANGEGKLRIDDSTWRIVGADTPAGGRVSVIGAEGVKLRVAAIEPAVPGTSASSEPDDAAGGQVPQ
jgi:membrane protein implicated in regulation of membrane protease activity